LVVHRNRARLPVGEILRPPTAAAPELIQVAGDNHKARFGHLNAERHEIDLSQARDLRDGRLALGHGRMNVARLDEGEVLRPGAAREGDQPQQRR